MLAAGCEAILVLWIWLLGALLLLPASEVGGGFHRRGGAEEVAGSLLCICLATGPRDAPLAFPTIPTSSRGQGRPDVEASVVLYGVWHPVPTFLAL